MATSHIIATGRFTAFGVTCVQSRPLISIANCVAVKDTTPSRIGGQVKRPSSSHFVTRTMPLPSHAKSFTRSDRFERKIKTSPQYGLARSASLTSADSVCTLFRKSTGCAGQHDLHVRMERDHLSPRTVASTIASVARSTPLSTLIRAPAMSISIRPRLLTTGNAVANATGSAEYCGASFDTAATVSIFTAAKLCPGCWPPLENWRRHIVSNPRATP